MIELQSIYKNYFNCIHPAAILDQYTGDRNTYRAFLPFDTPIRKIGFCPERESNPRLPDY